jgi:hypothetical protein
VSFLYPLFLTAGLALAIPVLIHLFNLRRYKTVLFPHTRFLKNIQLKSQKQSKLRYKWLLAARLLFLASLILAFAQPFFNSHQKGSGKNGMQVIYIDNSGSMLVKSGARTLLDVAKDAARKQVLRAPAGTRFLLLTNDKPGSYKPLPADKVLTELTAIGPTANTKTAEQVLSLVNNIANNESVPGADVYYYSDFQQNSFAEPKDKSLLSKVNFYGIPVQSDKIGNVYIDTAYFDAPVLQTGQNTKLIVKSKAVGKIEGDVPALQLSVNNQVKSATTLRFNDQNESIDTINFSLNDSRWQEISLTVNDALRFDDTFRITARSTPSLSVLLVSEGQSNPYIQAAFRAYNGFRLNQASVAQLPASFEEYNLIILNDVTNITTLLAGMLNKAMQAGKSVAVFPARTANYPALSAGLQQLADIKITGIDTAAQEASSLQQGSPLVRDIFETIPQNVQLPTATWHYIVDAGLSANQQAVLSFRNGDPLLAQYQVDKGRLYISSSSADIQSGNFAASYFFAPFLYQMAMQSYGADIYAITAGKNQPAFLPQTNSGERDMVHLYGKGIDAIPTQQPNGAGLNVFVDQVVNQPGFYYLSSAAGDSTAIALNSDRRESELDVYSISALKSRWKGENVHWVDIADTSAVSGGVGWSGFPLWKVCAILAVLMLAAETYLLAGGFRKQNIATQ